MKKTFAILLALALLLGFSLVTTTPVMAQSWLSGWSHRVEITIDSDKIDAALADFPVLLYLSTSSGIDPDDVSFVFDELGTQKLKLAVTTADGITQCYVEIEKWDSVSEQAWLWVKVPNIASGTDTTFYLYYDSTQPDNTTWVGETGTTPAENVWDNHFVFVGHMRDDPDISHIRDSTANGNNGAKKGPNEPVVTSGQIDDAQNFDGSDDYIGLTNEPAFDMQAAITVEGWIILDSFAQLSAVGAKWRNMGVDSRSWLLAISTGGEPRFYVSRNGVEYPYCPGSTLSTLTSYHLAGTYGDGYIRMFVNSSAAAPVALSGNLYLNDESVLIGANDGSGGTTRKYTDGIIDEVRISDIVRTAAWIRATYHSGDDNLLSYGSEESAPQCVMTATGTGTACFTSSYGTISDLASVSENSLPAAAQATKPINFRDGLFSFKVAGLSNGETVTVTITLPPGSAPTQYWKYHVNEGGWVQIPMIVVGPPNVIRITLQDGGLGDDDLTANGVIVDQGGPGSGAVGWETHPISKGRVLLPWIALLAAIVAGASLLVLSRRRAQS